jgi:hypothetical protein
MQIPLNTPAIYRSSIVPPVLAVSYRSGECSGWIVLVPLYLQSYCAGLFQRRPVCQKATAIRLGVCRAAIGSRFSRPVPPSSAAQICATPPPFCLHLVAAIRVTCCNHYTRTSLATDTHKSHLGSPCRRSTFKSYMAVDWMASTQMCPPTPARNNRGYDISDFFCLWVHSLSCYSLE